MQRTRKTSITWDASFLNRDKKSMKSEASVMTDWIASMLMKATHICFLIPSIIFYLIDDNSIKQYGFYSKLEEAKKGKFPLLCYFSSPLPLLLPHSLPHVHLSILLKLYPTLGVREPGIRFYRPIFYCWILELMI